MTRRLALAGAVAVAAVVPFGGSASALCQSVGYKTTASVGYCDEGPYWSWCAGGGVSGVGGASACQEPGGSGVHVFCFIAPSGFSCY